MIRKIRILMVEDETDKFRDLVADIEKAGYEVAIAESVGQARKALAGGMFDLLLLDIMLPADIPEWDTSPWEAGVCLLEKLRAGSIPGADKDMPVVVLSGTCDKGHLQRIARAGVSVHLEKPVWRKEVLTALREAAPVLEEA